MDVKDCYLKLPFRLNFESLLSDIQNDSIDFKKVGFNVPSIALPKKYSNELNKIFNLPDKDYFYNKSLPQQVFTLLHMLPMDPLDHVNLPALGKWHRDVYRESVIIITISDDDPDHYTEYKLDDDSVITVPYEKGVPFLLNTKIKHKVTNKSNSKSRNVIAISFNELNFYDVVNLFDQGNLVNYEELKNSFLYSNLA